MIEDELAAVPAGEAGEDAAERRQREPLRQHASGSARRSPQFVPTIATSVMAAVACAQLATRTLMPSTSRSSRVPTTLAATAVQKAKPTAQTPTRSQKASPVNQ
jgi:hypothetical protein